jgi:hypothetical protein
MMMDYAIDKKYAHGLVLWQTSSIIKNNVE